MSSPHSATVTLEANGHLTGPHNAVSSHNPSSSGHNGSKTLLVNKCNQACKEITRSFLQDETMVRRHRHMSLVNSYSVTQYGYTNKKAAIRAVACIITKMLTRPSVCRAELVTKSRLAEGIWWKPSRLKPQDSPRNARLDVLTKTHTMHISACQLHHQRCL